MPDFDWDSVPDAPKEGFDWDALPEEVQPPADPLMRAMSPPPPAPEKPSELEAGLRGAAQGATFGFSDELTGAALGLGRALPEFLGGMGENLGDAYRRERDAARAANRAAAEAQPGYYLGGEVVGGIGSALATGGAGAGLKGAVALGAASGFGHGEGTAGEQALQTAVGAGMGAASYGLSKAVGGAVRKISEPVRNFVSRRLAAAKGDVATEAALKQAKHVGSAAGKFGSQQAQDARSLEKMRDIAATLPKGHPDRVALEQVLASPEAKALEMEVARNYAKDIPGSLEANRFLRQQMEEAIQEAPGVAAAYEAEGLGGTLKRAVAPRAMRYVQRFAPSVLGTAAGGYIGHEIGGPEGTLIGSIAGAGAGSAAGAALGAPGTAFANMMRDPKVREHAWTAVQKMVAPGANVDKWLPTLMSAAARGGQSLAVTNYVLSQTDPEYRAASRGENR